MAYTCRHCNVTFDKVGQLARHYSEHKARGLPTRQEDVVKLLGEGKSVKEIRAMGFSARTISRARKLQRPTPPEDNVTRLEGTVEAYTCWHCNVTFDKVGQLARHYRDHKARGLPTREEDVAKLLVAGKSVNEIRAMGFSARAISRARKLQRPAPPEDDATRLRGIVDRMAALKEQVIKVQSEAEEVLAFVSGIGAEEEKIKALETELAQARAAVRSRARKMMKASPGTSKRRRGTRASKSV